MVRAVIRDVVLPFIVFPVLGAIACHFIFGHMYQSKLDVTISNACTFGIAEAPYRLRYVGLDPIDNALCPLVTFFQTAINSEHSLAFVTYFIGVGAPLVVVPAVEGWRAGRSRSIAYPVIFGVLYQTMTVGFTMPLYWLIFIVTGGTKSARHPRPEVSQAAAEAIVFGVIIGAAIPSVGMLVLNDPYVTAIWQPFPIYISVAQHIHLFFRPVSRYPQSGYQTILSLYLATFILCSSVHIATIWPIIGPDYRTVSQGFIPSVAIPPTSRMEQGIHHLLKWDFTVAFASSILVTFWFASSGRQLVLLAAWSAVATPMFGPGAAMMGAFLWREASLQSYDVGMRESRTTDQDRSGIR